MRHQPGFPTLAAVSFLTLVLASPPSSTGATESPQARDGAPRLVSPVGVEKEARVGTNCPTFSWTDAPGARSYTLLIYEVTDPRGGRSPAAEPVLRQTVPAGASSWTPSLESCLAPGRYGWAVGAVLLDGEDPQAISWSRPALFRVEGAIASEPARQSAAQPALGMISSPSPAVGAAPGLRAATGQAFAPPACASGGEMFDDVPASDPFCRFIELVARAGLAGTCDDGSNYCPDNPVTRRQLAKALLGVMYGRDNWAPQQGTNPLSPPADNVITTVDDAGTVGAFASITIGVDGLPIISYIDGSNANLKVAHCNDVACAGQDEKITTVDASNQVNFYTAISIGSDGLPLVSYYDSNAGNLKVAHCNDIACAGQDESVTTVDTATEAVGFTSSIAVGRDGLPIVSYQEDNPPGNASLRVAHCNDLACADQNETITEAESFMILNSHGLYSSIAISPDGFPSIAYVRGFGDVSFMRCNEIECVGSNESVQLVDPSTSSAYTSLTFGVDALPVMAYYVGAGTRDLRVAHCADVACATKNVAVVHSAGSVGEYSSIAIGADGLPIISYHDASAGALRVAHCDDLACAGSNETLVVVDDPLSGNTVGLFTSITIGADGLPIIAYFDQTAEALKVAHCANAFCAPYFRRR